ncbi:hypothetical protein [Oceanobacillus sp. FSL W7-1309]|uniref:hypothetical protein n=1 Tax=Oceanobacillus sp. FSL W7-1309 TaxID=2954539 RepID=UPI0030F6705E
MRITITGIQFKYDNGFDKEYTGVELNFITAGKSYSFNGPITVSKEDYQASSANNDELRALIKQTVIADLQAE